MRDDFFEQTARGTNDDFHDFLPCFIHRPFPFSWNDLRHLECHHGSITKSQLQVSWRIGPSCTSDASANGLPMRCFVATPSKVP